jgi:hypothetical protein
VDSTLQGLEDRLHDGTQQRAFWIRRLAAVALTVVVAGAVLGLLGVRTGEVSASASGYDLSVRYPAIARGGLDTPWEVTVHRDQGFEKEITIAVTGTYLDLFETQGFHPEPADSTRDATTLYLTFTAPESNTFVVAYDAYVQPASQSGQPATVAVVSSPGSYDPLVEVEYRTRLLP